MKSDYLRKLERTGNDTILQNIKQILSNIINNDDPKYRKLNTQNVNIKNIIEGKYDDILYKAGFIKRVIDFKEYIVFNYTNINLCKLKDIYNELNESCFYFKSQEIKQIKNWSDIKVDMEKRNNYHKELIHRAEEDRLLKLESERIKNEKLKNQQQEKKLLILENQEKVRLLTRGYLDYLENTN